MPRFKPSFPFGRGFDDIMAQGAHGAGFQGWWDANTKLTGAEAEVATLFSTPEFKRAA